MDMPNFSYNGKEEGWPCPDTHETDEVHNYLKEIRISVDKNIQFCHLKRFKSDTIKLAAQESGKKLQSTPADQAVEKKLKARPGKWEKIAVEKLDKDHYRAFQLRRFPFGE